MAESQQHKLDRVRRPRVHITYDVEDGGKMKKQSLPFVVGIMADLSAERREPLPVLKERKFADIDKDNFNEVLKKAAPRVAMKVEDKLTGGKDTKLAVELEFSSMDDFAPAAVAEKVPALKALLEKRKNLEELLRKTDGNDKLDQLLNEVLGNADKAIELAKYRGVAPETTQPEAK